MVWMPGARVALICLFGLVFIRTRLRNRWDARMDLGQLRLHRSLGSVLRELLGVAMALPAVLTIPLAFNVLDPLTTALMLGIGALLLPGYLAAMLRYAGVTFDLNADSVQRGAQVVGRAREVQTVEFAHGRDPLRLVFRFPDGTEARWAIHGVDPSQAPELAQEIGKYLRVAVRPAGT